MKYSEITPENRNALYEELVARYGSACGICGAIPELGVNGKRLRPCIDHDHQTDEVRGLLCSPCNFGIAGIGDCLEGVELALRYFARHHRIDDVYISPDW